MKYMNNWAVKFETPSGTYIQIASGSTLDELVIDACKEIAQENDDYDFNRDYTLEEYLDLVAGAGYIFAGLAPYGGR